MKMKEELEKLFGQNIEVIEGLNNELYLSISMKDIPKCHKNHVRKRLRIGHIVLC